MKSVLLLVPAALLTAVVGLGQAQPPPQPPKAQPQPQPRQVQQQSQPGLVQQQAQPQVYGRGRGGLPWAWNDRNRDGICDLTGQPVGQGRPVGFGLGRGRGPCGQGLGRGVAAGWGRGGGGWWGRGYRAAPAPVQPPVQTTPAQPQSPQQ